MHADEIIKEAEDILGRIPKKPDTSKLNGQQVKFLMDDYGERNKEIKNRYDLWFKKTSSIVGEKYNKDLLKTKETLSLDLRLKSAISLLKKIGKDVEEDAERRTIKLAEEAKETGKRIRQIITNGENNRTEFKSSLRWDHNKNEKNKNLETAIGKTICAFLNSEGGVLLIGVDDQSRIMGIDKDCQTLKRKDGDGFIQYLIQILNNMLGKETNRLISASIKNLDNREICLINVEKSPKPVFISHNNTEEFYIRASSTSQPLNVREAYEYIKSQWG
jgi:hypothetical protein